VANEPMDSAIPKNPSGADALRKMSVKTYNKRMKFSRIAQR
jgi:hypothetical protein